MSIIIETQELKEIFSLIIDKLDRENINRIELEEILYRFINTDNWSTINDNPDVEVGSLKDDWVSLVKCKNANEIISYVEFDRIASILRAISEKLAPIN